MLSDYILKIYRGENKDVIKKITNNTKHLEQVNCGSYNTKKKILKFITENRNKNGLLTNFTYTQIGNAINLHNTTVGSNIREMESDGILKCVRTSKRQALCISILRDI